MRPPNDHAMLIGDLSRPRSGFPLAEVAATLDDEKISFQELDRGANRLARALVQIGVKQGSLVAWWSGPALHNLTGMLACARLGAVFAPLAPSLVAAEAQAVLDYLNPRVLVCDGARLELSRGLAAPAPALIGTGGSGAAHELDRMCELAASGPLHTPGPDDADPHILYLTSGSTGSPKGVLVSHRASLLRSAPEPDRPRARGVLCTFPLYHYGGWHYVLEAWLQGTAVHLVSKADGAQVIEAVRRHRPTAIYCIPAVWERVLAERGDLSSIREADTGTSAVSEELLARIAERLPQARTRILYGASEAGRMTALEHSELADHGGSVGRAVGRGQLRIAEDGEILFAGPTLMNGYLGLPEQTGQALNGGWYSTGDLGSRDEDGFLYITGRKRDLIRTGGEWVSPAEVEAALGEIAGVRDLAVVGLPDERWGEIVCAVVVPADGSVLPSVEALRDRLTNLAAHKHPRAIAAVTEIPRTGATGQVMRATLRTVIAETAERFEAGTVTQ